MSHTGIAIHTKPRVAIHINQIRCGAWPPEILRSWERVVYCPVGLSKLEHGQQLDDGPRRIELASPKTKLRTPRKTMMIIV